MVDCPHHTCQVFSVFMQPAFATPCNTHWHIQQAVLPGKRVLSFGCAVPLGPCPVQEWISCVHQEGVLGVFTDLWQHRCAGGQGHTLHVCDHDSAQQHPSQQPKLIMNCRMQVVALLWRQCVRMQPTREAVSINNQTLCHSMSHASKPHRFVAAAAQAYRDTS